MSIAVPAGKPLMNISGRPRWGNSCAWAVAPSDGATLALADITCTGPVWTATAGTSTTFGTATGTTLFGVAMTNKSASTTYTVHSATDGTIVAQAQALAAVSGSVSDSVVSVSTGTAVTYNISQANATTWRVGITETTGSETLPEVTGTGLGTVARALAVKGATWAHRNLGGTYPEMTEYGCRAAANIGYGVIEISCQRTSDGVWIGAHDQTPDRVAVESTHDGVQFSALTSAQVLSMHINVGTTNAPQPFATLETLVGTLPSSYVYLLDPKQTGLTSAGMTDFIDKVDALLGPTRAIIKIDGSASSSVFSLAKDRGYLTAAYFYDSTSASKIAENMPYVDLPGLNYSADQSYWDAMLAYGKPVWGHVCPTQAAADTARAKGATYIQSTSATIAAVGNDAWRPFVTSGFAPSELHVGTSLVQAVYHGDTSLWART